MVWRSGRKKDKKIKQKQALQRELKHDERKVKKNRHTNKQNRCEKREGKRTTWQVETRRVKRETVNIKKSKWRKEHSTNRR